MPKGVPHGEFPMESFNQNVIRHKTGLLNLAAELGNISKACRVMGVSRDTFYRYQAAKDPTSLGPPTKPASV